MWGFFFQNGCYLTDYVVFGLEFTVLRSSGLFFFFSIQCKCVFQNGCYLTNYVVFGLELRSS